MTIQEWQELGYNLAEAKNLVELEKSERQYEEFAHIAFYSKHL
jgi:DNA-binding transcriptional MerR regulator